MKTVGARLFEIVGARKKSCAALEGKVGIGCKGGIGLKGSSTIYLKRPILSRKKYELTENINNNNNSEVLINQFKPIVD